jgi:hypothetical protein
MEAPGGQHGIEARHHEAREGVQAEEEEETFEGRSVVPYSRHRCVDVNSEALRALVEVDLGFRRVYRDSSFYNAITK